MIPGNMIAMTAMGETPAETSARVNIMNTMIVETNNRFTAVSSK